MGYHTSACAFCGLDMYYYSWDKAVKHIEKCKPQVIEQENSKP